MDAKEFHAQVATRLARISDDPAAAGITAASTLIADAIAEGGVVHAFGTGHSEGFAMEIAGRAGGLIPTSRIALRDAVLYGSRELSELASSEFERDPSVVDELWTIHKRDPRDIYIIASNSGINGSIVGLALKIKEAGHKLIAVTSLEHTAAVTPRHPSGKRLSEIADVVIDNLAPFGDTTLDLTESVRVGAVSSITAGFIAQLITIFVTEELLRRDGSAPVYISANVPGGDEHNNALLNKYEGRLRPDM